MLCAVAEFTLASRMYRRPLGGCEACGPGIRRAGEPRRRRPDDRQPEQSLL